MGAPERRLIDARLASLAPHERRFRLNAGVAWTGDVVRHTRDAIVIRNPRPFHGAPPGFPDLFGWDAVVVTQDMVGCVIAVASGEEVKAGTGRLSRVQRLFRDCLLRMGGRWRVVTSGEPRRKAGLSRKS